MGGGCFFFKQKTAYEVKECDWSSDVCSSDLKTAEGWGETPLSVQWVWPGKLTYRERHEALKDFCRKLAEAWAGFDVFGHSMEVGHTFQETKLKKLLEIGRASCRERV